MLPGRVFPSRAVTLLTLNAKGNVCVVVAIGRRREGFDVGGVTLQATRNDRPLEVGEAVAIAGAVYPAEIGPVRDGELEELILIPEEVGLAFLSRADDQGEAFGAGTGWGLRGLEKVSVVGVHAEREVRVGGLQEVVTRGEVSQDGLLIWESGGLVMGSLVECADLDCVTGFAGVIAQVAFPWVGLGCCLQREVQEEGNEDWESSIHPCG